MIIPLGPGSLRDSSSLPEGQSATLFSSAAHTGRASPPLLFGLAPRGVFRAPDVATRAVGSYPTFSPLPNAPDRKRPALGFASGLPQRCKRHRRFYFLWHFPWPPPRVPPSRNTLHDPLALPGALPCCGRLLRAHHSRSPDFPPADPSSALRRAQGKPAIIRLTRH
jgi:hypothetical protein